jgi:hypothetical protein
MTPAIQMVLGCAILAASSFLAGLSVRELAGGILEATSHWWSTAPWMGMLIGIALLARGGRRISSRST